MQVSNVSSSALTSGTGVIDATTGILKFLKCTPASACQGSGKCAVGYEKPENSCVGCVKGYYRLSGECVKCPELAHLFLALYIGVVVVFGIIGLLLVKKGPSIAVTGIGVDYYQVLSIFISFDIKVRNTQYGPGVMFVLVCCASCILLCVPALSTIPTPLVTSHNHTHHLLPNSSGLDL